MTGQDDRSPPRLLGTRLPKPGELVFVDLEASGLGPETWPIEIGLACILADGTVHSEASLIRPDPTWREDKWAATSAAVHGIPRQALDDAPSAPEVAQWAMDWIGSRRAVSDAAEFDGLWLGRLLTTLDPAPRLPWIDFDQVVASSFDRRGINRVYRALDLLPAPHRAGPDAMRLA